LNCKAVVRQLRSLFLNFPRPSKHQMYCYRCSARPPPTHADLSFATRVFTCGHSQSGAPRSQSVPHRFRNIKQSTTLRSRSARRLNIHERRAWYEGPRTREKSDAVNVEGGEPQLQVPSCDTGIYKRLDESKRQIRLLELHPGSGEEPISGNLVTVELPVLPLDFNEEIFFNELVAIADRKIVLAVRFGKWILQDDVDRWELIQNSLSWLFRYRLWKNIGTSSPNVSSGPSPHAGAMAIPAKSKGASNDVGFIRASMVQSTLGVARGGTVKALCDYVRSGHQLSVERSRA
jgi:hypothetical protein